MTSELPQFVLDTEHPWLKTEEAEALISSLANPSEAFSSLSSPIRPPSSDLKPDDVQIGYYPSDLYSRLEINNNRSSISRPGWANARERLNEMLSCPAALHDVKTLHIEIWIHDTAYYEHAEPPPAPEDVVQLFIKVLPQMPHLEELYWTTFRSGIWDFHRGFMKAKLYLPQIRSLNVARYYEWMVDLCPNVERLQCRDGFFILEDGDGPGDFIAAAGCARKLTHFSLLTDWIPDYIGELSLLAPQLTHISLNGNIRLPRRFGPEVDIYDYIEHPSFQSIINELRPFKNLTYLTLPHESKLQLSFRGGPRYIDTSSGPEARQIRIAVQTSSSETIEEASAIVLGTLPQLRSLCIGQTEVIFVRETAVDEYGDEMSRAKVKAVFPWSDTGLEAWVMAWVDEKYPLPEQEITTGMADGAFTAIAPK